MSALVSSTSNRVDLVNQNLHINERGQLIAAKKQIKSFLADYNKKFAVPELPGIIIDNVKVVQSGILTLQKREADFLAAQKQRSLLEGDFKKVKERLNQANGLQSILIKARNTLGELRKSGSPKIAEDASQLFSTAVKYLAAINNAIQTLEKAKSDIKNTLNAS